MLFKCIKSTLSFNPRRVEQNDAMFFFVIKSDEREENDIHILYLEYI
jgi:hypothetical protein